MKAANAEPALASAYQVAQQDAMYRRAPQCSTLAKCASPPPPRIRRR
jgi:hypothetical protein